jgi:hypothetical protein
VSTWSKNNPAHVPVFVNLELKDAAPADYSHILRNIGFKRAIPFDSLAYLQIDEQIMRIFGNERLLTPAMLRDTFTTTRARLDGNGDAYKK